MSASRRLLVSFVVLLLLPAATVVWLGVRLVAQDREIEAAQMEERRKSSADRAVAVLEQSLSATERRLPAMTAPLDDDAVVLTIHDGRVEASPPQRLLYYPSRLVPPEAPGPFDKGETLEFRYRDYAAAAAAFRELSAAPLDSVRAGALLRLARNLRRLGRSEEAARAYRELSRIEGISLDGIPAGLVARRALLQPLADDLLAGRWHVDRGAFFEYIGEHSVPPEKEALAEAAAWVDQAAEPSGRRALFFSDVPIVVLWQKASGTRRALIAGPRFQQREWFAGLAAQEASIVLAAPDGRAVLGSLPPPNGPAVRRSAAETALPWTVVVVTAPGAADPLGFAGRRRMLFAGLALLVGLVFAGGYLTLRAVSRELAVARLQSDFVSSVSHEFRTPLTSLRQFTDLLTDDDDIPPEKRRVFYRAQSRATERLHRLVESLLDFGRMEAGQHPYHRRRVEAAQLILDVVDEFRREVAPLGFEVISSIPFANGALDADPDALGRALWNLLDNAVKYSGESRTVWVDLERRNGSVAIRVRDHGLGIPVEERATIFQKFVRGSHARSRNIKGTGIGLSMVRHIVEGHGGSVELESTLGEGSTFAILIPEKE